MKKAFFAALALSIGSTLLAQNLDARDLSWLAGRWVDDSGGNLSEEVWTAPSGDSMQGMWRYVVSGKTRIYEISRSPRKTAASSCGSGTSIRSW